MAATGHAEMRAVRYRVLPGSRSTARKLNRLAGACRHVWNWALDRQRNAYAGWLFSSAERPPSPTFFTLGKAFIRYRHAPGREWLLDLPCAVVRYALKRQADAWRGFFEGRGGRPRFKARGRREGFTVPDAVRMENGRLRVPKVGWVRLRRRGGSPHPTGTPRQAVFTCEDGKWFCTVFLEVDVEAAADDGSVVGVDRNVGQCALSTGAIYRLPAESLKQAEAGRRRHQRRMARQVKGSNRRERTRRKAARKARKCANIRSDYAHRTSRAIADAAHTVVLEDLNVQGMIRSAKGTVEEPGRGVRAKAALNAAILGSVWGGLARCLEYKAGRLIHVPAHHTSQTCRRCGHVAKANRPTRDSFECQRCGHSDHADVNAGENIRRRGQAQLDGERRRRADTSSTTRQTGGGTHFVHFAA